MGSLITIGSHNWYLEGAETIVDWSSPPADVINTCYAPQFLTRRSGTPGLVPTSKK